MLGRVHIQTHNVADFLNQLRIWRKLERVGTVRLQSEGMPNPADRHPAESACFGQPAGTPVGLAARRAFQSLNYDLFDLIIADLAWRSSSRLVVQPFETCFQETRPPLANHAQ